ncbi:hypothetical protein [Streptomyces hirsutus]|uniref:hypothetical protein n=1 Tax=Streptomyces hirsutus TaxID=35620 RepID=UPI0033178F23
MGRRAGAEPLRVVAGLSRCADVGFDLVHVHRIGPDLRGFLDLVHVHRIGPELRGFLDFSRAKVPPRSQARYPGDPVTPSGPVTR